MKKQILVEILHYGLFTHVTPELWLQLQDCDTYRREGYNKEAKYTLEDTELTTILTTIVVSLDQLNNNPEVLEINAILAENNSLTRKVSDLEAQLARAIATKSSSNEVALS